MFDMKDETADRFRQITRILSLTLALNWAVALAKIIYGLVTNFSSMTADGFHSLSDGASNIVGLVGITLARRPPDKDHPYGHRKYETLFSLLIAGILAFVCLNLLTDGVKRLYHPRVPEINVVSIAVMLATMAVNIFVMSYEYREGRRLKSDILVSDSMHTRADIFTSCSVLAAMAVIKLGYPVFDPIVTMLIALFIAYTAFSILKQSSEVLCDTIAITDNDEIARIVLSVKGVKACHKIRTRGREDDIHIDLHVQVNPEMHVNKAHEVCYAIEKALKGGISGIADIVIHIEPKGR